MRCADNRWSQSCKHTLCLVWFIWTSVHLLYQHPLKNPQVCVLWNNQEATKYVAHSKVQGRKQEAGFLQKKMQTPQTNLVSLVIWVTLTWAITSPPLQAGGRSGDSRKAFPAEQVTAPYMALGLVCCMCEGTDAERHNCKCLLCMGRMAAAI